MLQGLVVRPVLALVADRLGVDGNEQRQKDGHGDQQDQGQVAPQVAECRAAVVVAVVEVAVLRVGGAVVEQCQDSAVGLVRNRVGCTGHGLLNFSQTMRDCLRVSNRD